MSDCLPLNSILFQINFLLWIYSYFSADKIIFHCKDNTSTINRTSILPEDVVTRRKYFRSRNIQWLAICFSSLDNIWFMFMDECFELSYLVLNTLEVNNENFETSLPVDSPRIVWFSGWLVSLVIRINVAYRAYPIKWLIIITVSHICLPDNISTCYMIPFFTVITLDPWFFVFNKFRTGATWWCTWVTKPVVFGVEIQSLFTWWKLEHLMWTARSQSEHFIDLELFLKIIRFHTRHMLAVKLALGWHILTQKHYSVFAPNPSSNLKIKYWRFQSMWNLKIDFGTLFWDFLTLHPHKSKYTLPTTGTIWYAESHIYTQRKHEHSIKCCFCHHRRYARLSTFTPIIRITMVPLSTEHTVYP